MSDAVSHPKHYIGTNGIEVINVIEGFGLGHHLGAAIAYILRADRKGEPIQDLKKAAFYIAREIRNREWAAERDLLAASNVMFVSAGEGLVPTKKRRRK